MNIRNSYDNLYTVRLVDGSSYNEGRVEVYYSGRWGTVCNDGLNDAYASLVCTQLEFSSSGELANFGRGTRNVLLEKVMCSLNTTVLASCGHYGVGITVQCSSHDRDVGVKCNVAVYVRFLLFIILLFKGNQATIQEITPTSSQNFSTLLPRYIPINNIEVMYVSFTENLLLLCKIQHP